MFNCVVIKFIIKVIIILFWNLINCILRLNKLIIFGFIDLFVVVYVFVRFGCSIIVFMISFNIGELLYFFVDEYVINNGNIVNIFVDVIWINLLNFVNVGYILIIDCVLNMFFWFSNDVIFINNVVVNNLGIIFIKIFDKDFIDFWNMFCFFVLVVFVLFKDIFFVLLVFVNIL